MIPDGAYLDPVTKLGWKIVIDGEIIGALFNSKGAALAGLDVERRRRYKCPDCDGKLKTEEKP